MTGTKRWTKQDVAEFLQVDVRTVERLDVPRVPLEVTPGKRPIVRYDPDEVMAWWKRRLDAARNSRPGGHLRQVG